MTRNNCLLTGSRKGVKGLSKEDLAGCLSSLTDMADTGVVTALPEIRINDGPPETLSPQTQRKFRKQLRGRIQRRLSIEGPAFNEQLHRQLQMLDDLESQVSV